MPYRLLKCWGIFVTPGLFFGRVVNKQNPPQTKGMTFMGFPRSKYGEKTCASPKKNNLLLLAFFAK